MLSAALAHARSAMFARDVGAAPAMSTVDPRWARRSLQEADATGWDPAGGLVHPVGGYAAQVVNWTRTCVTLTYVDADDDPHSDSGAAFVVYEFDGRVQSMQWYHHGQLHRANGPSRVVKDVEQRCEFHLHGHQLPTHRWGHDPLWGPETLYVEALELGADPRSALCWAWVGAALGPGCHHHLAQMRAAGAEPRRALEAVRSGVVEVDAIVRVATSRAPLSWALRR